MRGLRHADLLARVRGRLADDDARSYFAIHERRYDVLLAEVEAALAGRERPRVLDVGAAYEAEAIRLLLPDATVDTAGFADERAPPRPHERHVQLDLNEAAAPALGEGYDLVVLAEVLEHLRAPPSRVLRLLAAALRPGGTLIVQTPNAARLANRLTLLRGRNPFDPIAEDGSAAGHVREYTVDELLELSTAAGLEAVRRLTANYFTTGTRRNRLAVAAARVVPPRLRAGVTLVLRKPE